LVKRFKDDEEIKDYVLSWPREAQKELMVELQKRYDLRLETFHEDKNSLKVVDVEMNKSVQIYVECKTLEILSLLRQFLLSGQLMLIVECFFNDLMSGSHFAPIRVKHVDIVNYYKCADYFDRNSGECLTFSFVVFYNLLTY